MEDAPPVPADLGRRIRTERRSMGLSQTLLAEQVDGLTQSLVSKVEHGVLDAVVEPERLVALLGALGIEPVGPFLEAHRRLREQSKAGDDPVRVEWVSCLDADCGLTRLVRHGAVWRFSPRVRARTTVVGERCGRCGSILEDECPHCGKPLQAEVCCVHCGKPYILREISSDRPEIPGAALTAEEVARINSERAAGG